MARRASAKSSTSARSAPSKWCVKRSAVLGPIPGSRPSACVRRAIAPSFPELTYLILCPVSLHARQAEARWQAKALGDLGHLRLALLADLGDGLVDRGRDQLFQHFFVAQGLVANGD